MARESDSLTMEEAIDRLRTESGSTVRALSEASPILLVFLRHSGCPFCKEAVADVARARGALERAGVRPVFVMQGDARDASRLLEQGGLGDAERVLDPGRTLYRAMGLRRGNPWQMVGPFVWWRTLQALWAGRMIGRVAGDPFQMPGVFLLHRGRVIASHRFRSQADRPDYAGIASCPVDGVG
ncbi:MAG TPA: alkyl hydroperoxide reductase [Phycisphaerales bacterium]|nr:alkyl hydroperoxide reductase [Phycisphaerales bacterium]